MSRLYFIDTLRAVAIIMMLQGHFIHSLMDLDTINLDSPIYLLWKYFRGLTGPVFYTVSGFIFTFLLFKAKDKGNDWIRIRKGFFRALLVMGIGYSLKWRYNTTHNVEYFFTVDVLQLIGLSLLLMMSIYLLVLKNHKRYFWAMILIGTLMFITEPLYRNFDFSFLPYYVENYLSKANGSKFILLPWFGYIAFGAALGTVFFRFGANKNFKGNLIAILFVVGAGIVWKDDMMLLELYDMTGVELFKEVAYYNYLFPRLGEVLLTFVIFYFFEDALKNKKFMKVGENTLSIFVFHFIILYGSYFGLGVYQFGYKGSMSVEVVVPLAIAFIISSILCSNIYNKIKVATKKII
tara:strand:- start:608 stop:1657 length:1050 start_codon:yes stop_codon:yes gene_type:complete